MCFKIQAPFMIVLLLLLSVVLLVSCVHYDIIPNNITGQFSDPNETCFTLTEFALNNNSLDGNITFTFHPGNHTLLQRVVFDSATSVTMTNYICNSQQCDTKIQCEGTSGFEFYNIAGSIHITDLEFYGCGGGQIDGGALYFSNVSVISIANSRFIGNRVEGVESTGGAIHIRMSIIVSILGSYFLDNSAQCNYTHQSCNTYSGGGAIFLLSSNQTVITSCKFEKNIGYANGGAIASVETTLSIDNVTFSYNHAGGINVFGIGGAIYTQNGNISIIHSHYTNNTAQIRGGAISTLNSLVNASDSYFTSNAALGGGAFDIQGQNSSAIFSATNFINNSANEWGGAVLLVASHFADERGSYIDNRADKGGAVHIRDGIMTTTGSNYVQNSGNIGGAIYGSGANILTLNTHFISNIANKNGGAIRVRNGSLSSSGCYYTDNVAQTVGAVVHIIDGVTSTSNSNYFNNMAGSYGGVFFVDSSVIHSIGSSYTNNSASGGGVFGVSRGTINSSYSYYTSNIASDFGGAIFATECHSIDSSNHYVDNLARSSGGAVVYARSSVTITDTHYMTNTAFNGGAMYFISTSVQISNSTYSNNMALGRGGAVDQDGGSTFISSTEYIGNIAISGGAMSVTNTQLNISNSIYHNNSAETGGAIAIGVARNFVVANQCNFVKNNAYSVSGAITLNNGSFNTIGSHFIENEAGFGAGAIAVVYGNVSTVDSHYTNNIGSAIYVSLGSVSSSGSHYTGNRGGGVIVGVQGSISSFGSYYTNNTAIFGGALHNNEGNIYSSASYFLNNSASLGGAVIVQRGTFTSIQSTYIHNTADQGGAIFVGINSIVKSIDCIYRYNTASQSGGAVFNSGGFVDSSDTNFTDNICSGFGGAIFQIGGNFSARNSHFAGNKAQRAGGSICALRSSIYIDKCHYRNNTAAEFGGAIYTDRCLGTFHSISQLRVGSNDRQFVTRNVFVCREFEIIIPPNVVNSIEPVSEIIRTTFTNNTSGYAGGAITSVHNEISFKTTNSTICTVVLNGNTAIYGGGVALIESQLRITSEIKMSDNKATSGGGIFAYQSDIQFSSQQSQGIMIISNNIASQSGGGVHAITSDIEITRGIVQLKNNNANEGAGMYVERNSKVQLLKERQENIGEYDMKLEFINNSAQYGGAIFVSHRSDNTVACESETDHDLALISLQECFIQSILLNTKVTNPIIKNYINVFFVNNTASISGEAIYGGLLDRCRINPSAELVTKFPEYEQSTGLEYIKATAQFDELVNYDIILTTPYNPEQLISALTASDIEGLISSEPVRICFCLKNMPNCTYHPPDVFTKKGQLFRLSVVAVDQVGYPINAKVISSFLSNNAELNVDQATQETSNQCTELAYNVYPKGHSISAQIELYAEGPCSNIGTSKHVVNVTFLPCTCPIAFQSLETETQCTCDCDPILRPYIASCSNENETILRDSDVWMDYVNTTTDAGYLLHSHCPFDYCLNKPVHVNLNIPNGADVQCAFNRTGKLCGACKNNLSLVMGSSRCLECSDSYISILIPFALAGIAVVAYILILNLTVATGTIHGLIFYANVLVASRSIFIPFNTPSILNIFISWINLDLGIETCFYNGMDSYSKLLLQLVFPAYIILISITIIVISECSIRFATLIGKKDPVATLCTLILLSYSKLIRTIIASLQYTYLNYPDGSNEIVWLYDANVLYFNPSHIPRFLTAIVVIIIGSVYTVLIFAWEWIQLYNEDRNLNCLRWVNSPRYYNFIRKYHEPFPPKKKYWVGLLLFARIIQCLISAFVQESATLLSVGCITLGIVILKLLSKSTYENYFLDALETSYLLNLGVLTMAVFYVREASENNIALSSISIGISFVTFMGIFAYHAYTYVLKDTNVWLRIAQWWKQFILTIRRRQNVELVEVGRREQPVPGDNIQESILSQRAYTNENDSAPVTLPRRYDPPVIVSAVRHDQLREPDLDILDPITADDYRQLNQPPAPRPRPAPTSTVI